MRWPRKRGRFGDLPSKGGKPRLCDIEAWNLTNHANTMLKYQFTDTDLAAKRLEVLAKVYAPSSRKFIRDLRDSTTRDAVDLGCGPGYTTELLRDETEAESTLGLDNSERFINAARARDLNGISFYVHDVTKEPFPVGPSKIAYCRFLLSHLPDLPACLGVWARQLRSKGLLLLEEVETIHSTVQDFEEYLVIVDRLLAHQSAMLYVGPVLDRVVLPANLHKVSSRVQSVLVSVRDAAAMFHLNIQSWRHQPYIRETYEEEEIQSLQDRLGDLASTGDSEGEIQWDLRQMVLRRG